MKINFFKLFAIGCFFAQLFAAAENSTVSISSLSERASMIEEAFKLEKDKAIEQINSLQQGNKIATTKSADSKNYVVVIKKEEDGSYTRVAHYKQDKVGQKIEDNVLLNVVKAAEEKLKDSSKPIDYDFKLAETTYYAAVSKFDNYFVFNITTSKEELDKMLNITTTPTEPTKTVEPIKTTEPAKQ